MRQRFLAATMLVLVAPYTPCLADSSTSAARKPESQVVHLLSPGKEPLAPLKRVFQPGQPPRKLWLSMLFGNESRMGDEVVKKDDPTPLAIQCTARLSRLEPPILELGFLEFKLKPAQPLSSKEQAVSQARIKTLKGMLWNLHLDYSGSAPRVEGLPSSGKRPELATVVEEMLGGFSAVALPLPDQPVGVGASWEALIRFKRGNQVTPVKVRYELIAREGEVVTLVGTGRQPIDFPALPEAAKAMTCRGELTLNLKARLDLTRPEPVHAEIGLDAEIGIKGGNGKDQPERVTHARTRVTWSADPPF